MTSQSMKRSTRVGASLLVFGAVVVYTIAQPQLNQRLGWSLPGLFEEPAAKQAANGEKPADRPARPLETDAANAKVADFPAGDTASTVADLELGQLRDLGRDVKMSAAGLVYAPGSAEGHRLDHVLRHSRDDPDRPGSHGVFDGGREGTLAVIDEAYLLTKEGGGAAVKTERDGNRTVYTVSMGRPIGFVGGSVGRRQDNPKTTRVRLVLEGVKIITAYPMK